MERDGGLQLTTKRIRSKHPHRSVDLNKQLKNTFRHSIVNAQRRTNKQKKSEKILKLTVEILDKCEVALRSINYEELKGSISDLDASYKAAMSHSLFSEMEEEKDEAIKTNDGAVEKREKESIVAKKRNARVSVKKTLSKSQASFKKKLDRLTETIRIVESSKKIVEALKKQIYRNESKMASFKKHLCVEMKANFDPLFGGAIGYENCARTDPYGDNLSKSVWDSKTSKPS